MVREGKCAALKGLHEERPSGRLERSGRPIAVRPISVDFSGDIDVGSVWNRKPGFSVVFTRERNLEKKIGGFRQSLVPHPRLEANLLDRGPGARIGGSRPVHAVVCWAMATPVLLHRRRRSVPRARPERRLKLQTSPSPDANAVVP
jgi:hypothetical protein